MAARAMAGVGSRFSRYSRRNSMFVQWIGAVTAKAGAVLIIHCKKSSKMSQPWLTPDPLQSSCSAILLAAYVHSEPLP